MKKISQSLLKKAIARIVRLSHPLSIYLYGSHAYGEPDDTSDIDILVVLKESSEPPHKRAVSIYMALRGLFVPFEVKVDTQEEFEKRSQWLISVERFVVEKGRLLYESQF
jgi:predicted nucleotidyltransferase